MGDRQAVGTALGAVGAAVDLLDSALRECASDLTRDEWLAVVGGSQCLVNRLTGLQDASIASVARIDGVWNEDGTVGEEQCPPGRVSLDAADLVAPRLGVSHHRAQLRVEAAVRLTGREPMPTDMEGHPERTGLDGLHTAMRAGRIDEYRASVVADELLEVPADVAGAVVAALDPHLDAEPPASLRRRVRRLLLRISPDLLRQRAERARRETGLRRWVAEPGVDAWSGTFPSEESAAAWAAVDALARRYVTDGVCRTIEQARGKALTDLVTQQADVRVQLVLTTPAAAVEAVGVTQTTGTSEPATATETSGTTETTGTSETAAATETSETTETTETPRVTGTMRAATEPMDTAAAHPGAGPRVPFPADALVQVNGARPSEPVLVDRRWLERVAVDVTTRVLEQRCHPDTGARLDPGDELASEGYRPGQRLTALVKARDGRCRFPGCSVASRFCDLDHVRPWPTGPTTASNLLCLCRRHHRVKQAPGWSLRLHPDGVAVWSNPSGSVITTEPLDALEHVVLLPPAPAVDVGVAAVVTARVGVGAAPVGPTGAGATRTTLPSVLEEAHEHRLDQHEAVLRQRRCSRAGRRQRAAATTQHRRRWLEHFSGDPPF